MILPILKHPDARLKSIANEVIDFSSIKEISSNMLETMYAANGIGLAATQVNIPLRVIVIDISLFIDDSQLIIFDIRLLLLSVFVFKLSIILTEFL